MIRFIKTKHSKTYFVAAKVVMNWQRQNTSYLGWLQKNVGTFEKYSLVDKDHDQAFNFYFSPGVGIKAHITPNIGVIASVTDEAYLIKGFDVNHKDYRSKLSHSIGLNIGICFQINGW